MLDVAVIGAGPAGTAAAIWCADRGLDVTLIEAARFPRYRPGETLHPGVEPILTQLGVSGEVNAAGFLRHPGIHLSWDQPQRFVSYGSDNGVPWKGYQAWRATFDDILIRRAKRAGVRVFQPCVAKQPIVKNNRVEGVVVDDRPIHSRFVLDATGSSSWLANRLALTRRQHSRRLIARYGYVRSAGCELGDLPRLVRDETGWTWIAQIRPDLLHWTWLSVSPESFARDCTPDQLREFDPVGPIRTADVTWFETLEPAGSGYFLLGDAAVVIDPLSSHGVLKALMSGMQAAHLILQCGTQCSETEAATAYTAWIQSWFRHDTESLTRLYADAGIDIGRG